MGLGAAAVGGTALGGLLAGGGGPRLTWEHVDGFPDRPVELHLEGLAGALHHDDGDLLGVRLRLLTPRGEQVVEAGGLVVSGPSARGRVALVYPYDGRVPGHYEYHAEVTLAGRTVRTGEPARYSVRRWVPLS